MDINLVSYDNFLQDTTPINSQANNEALKFKLAILRMMLKLSNTFVPNINTTSKPVYSFLPLKLCLFQILHFIWNRKLKYIETLSNANDSTKCCS